VFFFARALQLLREGGWLAFVTSDKFMRAAYGEKLRTLLPARVQIAEVINFGDLPVFPVAAYPSIVIGRKQSPPDLQKPVIVADLNAPIRRRLRECNRPVSVDSVRGELENLPDLVTTARAIAFPQALLRRQGWFLADPVLLRLFDRLMNAGVSLGKRVDGRLFRGVVTGLNEAFVIDSAARDELIAADPRSAELIKPWLRGRDVERWAPRWAGLYVIFTRRGVEIGDYPAIRDHLARWRLDLEPKPPGSPLGTRGRKPGDYRWYEIQDAIAYWPELERPKAIWPDIARHPRFSFDDAGHYVGNTVYFSPALSPVDVALLNSAVGAFLISMLSPAIQNGYRRYFSQYVETLPLPATVPDTLRRNLSSICVTGDESELDRLAFEAYGLGTAERSALATFRHASEFADASGESEATSSGTE
jgi:hypothetical protein